jgi:aspartate kinase
VIVVQKFGGTSVGSVALIERAAERVIACRNEGHQVVVVVSAMGEETDRLVSLATAIQPRPDPREYDVLLAAGEQVSIALLAMALKARGCEARSYLANQVPICTEAVHNKARITHVATERLQADLAAGIVPVIAGFQGVDPHGNVTTLGRGGSDTTAVAVAVALRADECQILTDVEGVYTTDPRLVPEAQLVRRLSFEEMLELASQGSKVLQIRAVEFAAKHGMALRVMSSGSTDPGTLIAAEDEGMEAPLVAGVAFNRDEAEIVVTGVPHGPMAGYEILEPVSSANIEVDMIVLNGNAAGRLDVSFTVHRSDYDTALSLVRRAMAARPDCGVFGNDRVVKISVIGVGMRSHAGIATRMFAALAREGISVRTVSTSEIKISVLVDERHLERGVLCLHEAFQLSLPPEARDLGKAAAAGV